MKIGILSDIHANLYALEVVVELLEKENISKLLILGDIIGYYYNPKEVLDLLKKFDICCVKGNHEQMLEDVIKDSCKREFIKQKYGNGIEIALQTLEQKDIDYLKSLPHNQIIEINSIKIWLCHGSPWDMNYYIYPDAKSSEIDKFDDYKSDYIFFGHTHYATIFEKSNKKIINPGSVGQSRQQGGFAYFGILDTVSNDYIQQKLPYNIDELLFKTRNINPNLPYLSEILSRK